MSELEKKIRHALMTHKQAPTIELLAGWIDAKPTPVSEQLALMRANGEVVCTNKTWWLKDIQRDPPKPKAPRAPSAKMEKFLKKQTRMF